MHAVNSYTRLLRGLALFNQRLAPDHVRYADFLVFEHRLTENIDQTQLYGDTPERASTRAQIISGLNGLAMELFGQSFNDLCIEAEAMRQPQSQHGPQPQPNGAIPANHPPYYLSAAVVELLSQICTVSGYHLVLAEAGFGKTVLVSYLSRQPRPTVVSYSFTRIDGRRSVDLALESLRDQLQSLGNLTSAHHYSLLELIQTIADLVKPWSVARKRNWPQLLILLDGLDECDHSERCLFHELLPAQLPANVGVVVTMRPAVRQGIAAHFAPRHLFSRSAIEHHLQPLHSTDIQRLLFEQHHIYAGAGLCHQIAQISAGHPAAVISLGRSLEEALQMEQDPDEVIQQIPPLHTFQEIFAHDLRQMEQRSTPADRPLLRLFLATLAVAQPPLQAAQLAEILDTPPAAIEALAQRLDRFLRPTADGSLTFSQPQFSEYLLRHRDWSEILAHARACWNTWSLRQQETQSLASAFVARAREQLVPALSAYAWAAQLRGDELFCPAVRSREDWISAITLAWDAADSTAPIVRPEQLICYALLITSWPHWQIALPPHGEPSPDHSYSLVLTDQLRDSTGPTGRLESRDFFTLLSLLSGDLVDRGLSPESLVLLVSEIGQAWYAVADSPHQHFPQILRLITQAVRRQATVSPIFSPRANLIDALSALAPAIRYHFPASTEPICDLVETIIDVFP